MMLSVLRPRWRLLSEEAVKPSIERQLGLYVLRSLRDEDVEQARVLRNGARHTFWSAEEISEEQQKSWYAAYLARSDDLMFVAVRGGEVVGTVGLQHYGAEPVEFGRLVVADSERRRGLGLAMSSAAVAIAFERGAKHVVLTVRQDNVPARVLYARLGFREVGRDDGLVRMSLGAPTTEEVT